MASDLASLNNALATQAANEGISISLTNSNNQLITTTNPATIDIDPSSATGSGVTTNSILSATSITANVKTAMPGYSLSISTNLDNNSLTNTDSVLGNTQNGSAIQSTAGTQDSPTTLSTNTWGYAMNNDGNNKYTTKFDTAYTVGTNNPTTSKWAKVPTSQEEPQTIKTTEDTPPTEGDNTTVYYGVNVPKNKTAGQYQTTITYTATANVLDPPKVEKVEPSSIRQSLQMTIGETEAVGRPGQSNYQPAQTFACYVTTAGSVYCGSSVATAKQSTSGSYTTNYDFDSAAWLGAVSPTFSRELTAYGWGSDDKYTASFNAYTPVESQSVSGQIKVGSSLNLAINAKSYWFKIDTSKFDSSSSSAGTTITLTGKNLSKVTNVYIDANNNGILDEGTDVAVSNLKITSDTELTFTAPSMSAGTYNIIVVNPGNVVVGGTLTYR